MRNRTPRIVLDVLLSLWSVATTAAYTVLLGIPTIMVAMVSKTGKLPFRIGRLWAWLIMRTNRVRLQVVGMEKIVKSRSYVFIANHASNLDPPLMLMAFRGPLRFIAKQSLARIPIFGLAAKLGRMIFIDRNDSAKAIEAINNAVRELKGGISAFFFAEGARSADGMLKSFKKGGVLLALKARLPIIPVTIVGSHALLPKRSLCIRPGSIRVIVGDPIETVGYAEEDRDILVQKVREVIATNLEHHAGHTGSGISAP